MAACPHAALDEEFPVAAEAMRLVYKPSLLTSSSTLRVAAEVTRLVEAKPPVPRSLQPFPQPFFAGFDLIRVTL